MTRRDDYDTSNTFDEQPDDERTAGRRRLVPYLLIAGVGLLVLWLALKGLRIGQAANSLLSLQEDARALAADGLMSVDPAQLEGLASRARNDIVTLKQETAMFLPLASRLGGLPRVGPLLESAPALLNMADAGSEAGVLVLRGLEPALSIVTDEGFGLSRMGDVLPLITTAEPELTAAAAALDRYQLARTALDATTEPERLPWSVRQLLALADENLPLAEQGLEMLPLLPGLLGEDGARRYLILAQNEDELRATGGFITGAGVVTVEDGRIIDLRFIDAYQIDNWREKPYDFPPQPLNDFMLAELFLFRDSNFWADFPTSAEKASALYAYGQDSPMADGAIAIDQEFLRMLVEVVGPIPVAGSSEAITGDNLIRTLRSARDPREGQEINEWVNNRKAFLGGFAAAIQSKLETNFGAIDPVYLARQMLRALETRHVQLYLPDPETAAAIRQLGWDGRLPDAPPGDLLAVVDMNVGFNKANVFVDRSVEYAIDLAAGDGPTATVSVSYRHTGDPLDEPCYQGVAEEYEAGEGYLAIANKCYWNYLRVYAPAGSTLIDASRSVVLGETLFSGETWDRAGAPVAEFDRVTTFANLILVPQAGNASAFFTYGLPKAVITSDGHSSVYELHIQKQAGARPEPVRVTVTLPAGASLVSATPRPTAAAGQQLTFELTLETNTKLTLVFR